MDALYIKILPGQYEMEARSVDDDIALDFDETDRLVGIEVLDVSKRLDLGYLLPVEVVGLANDVSSDSTSAPSEERDNGWRRIQRELVRRKEKGIPVKTVERGWINWVEDVGDDYVVVKRDTTENTRKISRRQIAGRTKSEWSVTRAIRALGDL